MGGEHSFSKGRSTRGTSIAGRQGRGVTEAVRRCMFSAKRLTPCSTLCPVTAPRASSPSEKPPLHVAFRVDTRGEVEVFYAAAMAAGGTDNGAPGVRAHYHRNYYAAFVRDPDGHNIEAVCHAPV